MIWLTFRWKAANYSFFWGKTLNDGIKYRLGTMPPSDQVLNMNPIIMDSVDQPPESFDSRQKWPNYIHPVRDQGDCAASWAFSTAGKIVASINNPFLINRDATFLLWFTCQMLVL